jgi:dUTP pyrophosphatase
MRTKLDIYLHKDDLSAQIPKVAYEGTSACFDITCIQDTIIPARGRAEVPNGLNLVIDKSEPYYMMVHLRSSKGFKLPLMCHPGIIDAGYTGPLGIMIYNMSDTDIKIEKGEKYAQMSIHEKIPFNFVHITRDKFTELKSLQLRGDNGFGSSGK